MVHGSDGAEEPVLAWAYRVRLYAKPSRADRSLVFGSLIVILAVLLIGVSSLRPTVFVLLLLGVTCLYLVVLSLVVLRTGAWLEQTRLVIRGGFSRRERDLAAAAAWLVGDRISTLPVLIVEQAGRAPVHLVLREPGGRVAEPLAPHKLQALAAAILAGEQRDPARIATAGQLLALAGAPPAR